MRSKTNKEKTETPKGQKQEAAADPIHNPTEHQNGGEVGKDKKSHQTKPCAINETGPQWTQS